MLPVIAGQFRFGTRVAASGTRRVKPVLALGVPILRSQPIADGPPHNKRRPRLWRRLSFAASTPEASASTELLSTWAN